MAAPVQRDSSSSEGVPADPGLHLQLRDAAARVLARAAARHRVCGQVRRREYLALYTDEVCQGELTWRIRLLWIVTAHLKSIEKSVLGNYYLMPSYKMISLIWIVFIFVYETTLHYCVLVKGLHMRFYYLYSYQFTSNEHLKLYAHLHHHM